MNNVYFIELIIESFNNTFTNKSYESSVNTLTINSVNISDLNESIKDKFRHSFVSELKRNQKIIHEKDKLELGIFLDKLKDANFSLGDSVLEYKEREFEMQKRLSYGTLTDIDKFMFFETMEASKEYYNISLSTIIPNAKKEIKFNLIDFSFITQTIDSLSIVDFESKNESELIDLSDATPIEKIIYLEKLGIIDFLRKQQPFDLSTKRLSEVLSGVTGIKAGTLQSNLNPMISKSVAQKNNPLKSQKNVDKVENALIKIGFNLKKSI